MKTFIFSEIIETHQEVNGTKTSLILRKQKYCTPSVSKYFKSFREIDSDTSEQKKVVTAFNNNTKRDIECLHKRKGNKNIVWQK